MSRAARDFDHLSVAERIQLVEDIWDSIAEEANVRPQSLPLTDAQCAELQRRVADADAHPEDSVPWETVRGQLFKRGG